MLLGAVADSVPVQVCLLWACVCCVVEGFGEVLAGLVGIFCLLLAILSTGDQHLYCVCCGHCWQHCQSLTNGHASLNSLGVLSGWWPVVCHGSKAACVFVCALSLTRVTSA
jgi:hypothetical protein